MKTNDRLSESVLEKLKKIQALAETGVEGERETAARLLAELCAKHQISPEELTATARKWCEFSFVDVLDRRLVIQCAVYVCRTKEIENGRPAGRRNVICFKLTKAEEIDLRDAVKHYRNAWKAQLADLFEAFVHANRIYGPKQSESNDEALTDEQMARLRRLASISSMMPSSPWKRQLRICA